MYIPVQFKLIRRAAGSCSQYAEEWTHAYDNELLISISTLASAYIDLQPEILTIYTNNCAQKRATHSLNVEHK